MKRDGDINNKTTYHSNTMYQQVARLSSPFGRLVCSIIIINMTIEFTTSHHTLLPQPRRCSLSLLVNRAGKNAVTCNIILVIHTTHHYRQ